MNNLSLLLELFINGLFICLYALSDIKAESLSFINPATLNDILGIFTKAAPFIVIPSIISNYRKSASADEFFRKHIFSLIVAVPMFITYGDIQFTFWLASMHLLASVLSIYDTSDVDVKKQVNRITTSLPILERIKLAPAQIVIVSFSAIVLIGTLLLALPISAQEGKSISLIDAFFTATSATCVTGLSTLSVADNLSFFGQIVLLALIQIGGLGYMTLYSSMTILLGKSLAVRDQVMMQDVLDISSLEDLINMIVNIIKYTLVIEFCGAVILTAAFSSADYEFGEAIYYGLFHSISAFCNAGFALFPDSLEAFSRDPLINMTISSLIILGGLGFIVIKEVETNIRQRRKLNRLSVHSKIVLITNLVLVAMVTLFFFVSELFNGLRDFSLLEQIQVSIFQAVTLRTAGFNTIPLSQLYPHTIYLMVLIMFIGASPGSTGGGIKTTTFAILFQSVKATLRGRDRVEFFQRTIPNIIVVRAVAIIVMSLIVVSFFILLMMKLEPEHGFLPVFFEVVSAFATVGLSLGITPDLSELGKLSIVVIMFIGRVGPLTLALALGKKTQSVGKVEYPEGRVMIG